jgi:hypothetical protein
VSLCVLASASALAFEAPRALQNHSAGMSARTAVLDCEQSYRSFRARNTLTPGQRRAARERCHELAEKTVGARGNEAAVQGEKPSPDREVALGD